MRPGLHLFRQFRSSRTERELFLIVNDAHRRRILQINDNVERGINRIVRFAFID